jgi:hypothetical protein
MIIHYMQSLTDNQMGSVRDKTSVTIKFSGINALSAGSEVT